MFNTENNNTLVDLVSIDDVIDLNNFLNEYSQIYQNVFIVGHCCFGTAAQYIGNYAYKLKDLPG